MSLCPNSDQTSLGVLEKSSHPNLFLIIFSIRHDFDKDHSGKDCNTKGLMSYGHTRPDQWSTCSDEDFKSWWKKEGHTCVKSLDPQHQLPGILDSFRGITL